ncbi:MAG: Sua5/YciO/YrdC/YwlC family protein [Nanoarchaeota archaeon]
MIISKQEFLKNKKFYLNKIKNGSIFIYPTDTIYGLGAILNKKNSNKIRKIKQRTNKPFSIIVPSKKWIKENCITNRNIKKLPGKYTLILNLKNKKTSPNPNLETLGVRIPKHWISQIAKGLNKPIITTSVNISNKPYMTSLKNLNKSIKSKVDFIIYQGYLNNKPSKIILNNKIIKR